MKKTVSFLLVLLLAVNLTVCAAPISWAADTVGTAYYIDSVGGDDASDGTTPQKAWKTTQNVPSIQWAAGDQLLFKCGGEYDCTLSLTCSGTKEAPICISAYGDGAAPVLTTTAHREVLQLFDCSYITVSDLEITAHNGGGIWINTRTQTSYGITVENVVFHDMQNDKVMHSRDNLSDGAAAARACIMVKGFNSPSLYAVNDLTIRGCEMYDCGNGISLWGTWSKTQQLVYDNIDDIDPIFNTGALVEDCYFHDMDAEAIIVGVCDGALVTNCRAIDCCLGEGVDENGDPEYFNAAMWFWGSVHSTIQYCEIAGQKNVGDGMSIDFDSYSNYCTYQYIYSHDNQRFMCNCAIYNGQRGNTVRYCLSVNDGGGRSRFSSSAGEYGFKFYNNTVIGCGDVYLDRLHDSVVANNIIIPKEGCYFTYNLDTVGQCFGFKSNCYYNTVNPLPDLFARNIHPGFSAGTEKECFMLASGSPLIGAGIEIDGDECEYDFFGYPIVSRNIGCYGGTGTQEQYRREPILHRAVRYVVYAVRFVYYLARNKIQYLIDRI